ncbi:MAG: hypothetical protein J5986_02310 [Roseburia sp.]|nr:hypothetical protein [Roseburia sp.]
MNGKNMTRLISLLLCLVLMTAGLGGCKKTSPSTGETNGATELLAEEGGTGGKGRFLETELPLPENIRRLYDTALLENGTIALFLWNDKENIYQIQETADEGESWKVRDIDLEAATEIFAGYIDTAAISADGTVGILSKNDDRLLLGLILPDGSVEKRELTLPDMENQEQDYALNITGSAFDAEGSLLIENLNSHFYKVDLTTGNCELLQDLEEKYIRHFGVAGNKVLAVAEGEAVLFDSTTGELLEEETVLNDMLAADSSLSETVSDSGKPLVFAGENGGEVIFYVNHQGLFCHTPGGSVSEQLINGSLTSMGDTTVSFLDLVMVDEEHFLLTAVGSQGEAKLLKYSYDKDAPSVPETELKVYALEDSSFLRQVISAYQKEHQDVYVNLQIGLSGDDGMTAEDAVRALNTDILAGSGPDVLILDGLPAEKYIEKGMLADISPVIEEIAGKDGIFENVRQAYDSDGAIYQFPARFYVSLVNGEEEAVEAGSSLKKLADFMTGKKTAGESKIFPMRSAENLLEKLYAADSAAWMESDGKLTEEAVKEYLSCAKQIYDAEPTESEDVYYSYGGMASDTIGTLDATGVALKTSKLNYGTIVSMTEFTTVYSMKSQYGIDYELADRETVKSFVPCQLAGISSQTEKSGEAEEFLQALLGAECGAYSFSGFPVNRTAYEEVVEDAANRYDEYSQGGIAVSTDEGDFFEMTFENPTPEELDKITGILESAEKPACMDRVIKEIVLEQGEKALKGDMTVEEAVSEIMKKCSLYLAE